MKDSTEECYLDINGLTKIYAKSTAVFNRSKNTDAVHALDNVCFHLTPGLYGLLGPNGAGKSTLINIITGSLLPTSGSVQWCGQDIHTLGKDFRKILGYMPQQQGLYERYTGQEFLQYMAALKQIPTAECPEAIMKCAAQVNLCDQLQKRLGAYSGGMKQRLLAACALLGNPKLLIMDEPTAGLDPKERVRLRQLMAELAHDRIILVATHVVSDVESVAAQIFLLRKGKLVDSASPTQLIQKYAPGQDLESVYLHIFGEEDGR